MLSEKLSKKKKNLCTVSILRKSSAAVRISFTATFHFLMDPRSGPQNLVYG